MYINQWLSLVFTILFSLNIMAQESADSTTSVENVNIANEEQKTVNPPSGKVEKLEVTGSHIKRIDIEGPSPILSLDREYLDRSGYNSVADVLRDSTVTATGVGREASGSNTAGAATTGLRGFGSDKILVLLNGNRLSKIGGGNSVDLNLIPFQAIERVDILKDGASATYGSDALAGVINFITKKDFDGASIMVKYAHPEQVGGNRQDIAAVYGKNFNKGNVLGIYQYRNNTRINDRDRPWSHPGLSNLGSPGYYQPVNPADKDDTGVNMADPLCPAGQTKSDGNGGTRCTFDYTPYSSSLPDIEQHSAVLTGEYQLNSELKLYTNLLYTTRQARWQYAPAPDIFADDRPAGGNFQIPNSTAGAGGWNLPGIGANDVNVGYRFVDELGPRSNRDTTDSYGGTVGTKGYFADTWDWDLSVTYGGSQVHNKGHAGYANKDILLQLMNTNQFNPFAPAGSKGDISTAKHTAEEWIDSSVTMTQMKVSGELGQFGEGVLSSAFGVSGAWEDYKQRVDAVTQAGSLFGGSGAAGGGSRNYQSLFTELNYTIRTIEFQLAGRYDQYSDFGGTFNPKFAFRYTAMKEVLFRGSVGTGFKAPTLDELYSAQGYGYPTFKDQVGCTGAGNDPNNAMCQQQQYKTFTGGNARLRQETSFSYNLGTVIQPTRDLHFSLDYWFTSIDDAIGFTLDDLLLAEAKLGNATVANYGAIISRDGNSPTGLITSIFAPNLNLAQKKAEGLEFTADYTFNIAGVTLTPHMDHTQMLSFLEEPFPGMGLVSKLGESGRPRWKNTSYLTVRFLEDHSFRFTGRTIAGQYKIAHTSDRSDQRKLATYTEYDLNYNLNLPWNAQFSTGVKNLFNTKRPYDDTAQLGTGLNTSLYDQIGQLYYLGYTQNF